MFQMREVLKIDPIPVKDSFIDMAYSLIDSGFVKKHKNYKGRPTTNSKQDETQAQQDNQGSTNADGEAAASASKE